MQEQNDTWAPLSELEEWSDIPNYRNLYNISEVREIYNLFDFCKNNELVHQYMHKVHQGVRDEHKGWTKYE